MQESDPGSDFSSTGKPNTPSEKRLKVSITHRKNLQLVQDLAWGIRCSSNFFYVVSWYMTWIQLFHLYVLVTWFPTFLMLQLFNIVLRIVMTFNYKTVSLLLHNHTFATVMNCSVNIWYAGCLICNLQGGPYPQVVNCWLWLGLGGRGSYTAEDRKL